MSTTLQHGVVFVESIFILNSEIDGQLGVYKSISNEFLKRYVDANLSI